MEPEKELSLPMYSNAGFGVVADDVDPPSSPSLVSSDGIELPFFSPPSSPALLPTEDVDPVMFAPLHDTDDFDHPDCTETTEKEDTVASAASDVLTKISDDSGVSHAPSCQVDYLSYEWTESTIWSARKLMNITGMPYATNVRLNNALWREWAKLRNNLGTVPANTIEWYAFHP
jgi:hypothetical protein